MFRKPPRSRRRTRRFPHACGDVPIIGDVVGAAVQFSPRLWGCSGVHAMDEEARVVFPTPVGMFRQPNRRREQPFCFPHACGDVPERASKHLLPTAFSPRLWGCSVRPETGQSTRRVFPTPVGMFRKTEAECREAGRFPHACGDVPKRKTKRVMTRAFSPRLWGCSGYYHPNHQRKQVFPTPVGMFRPAADRRVLHERFPHACGDVPGTGSP